MGGIKDNDNTNTNINGAEGSSSYLGPGHTSVLNPAESSGEFLGLRNQKGAAQAHTAFRVAESGGFGNERPNNGDGASEFKETCDTEDHSFMGRKPGGPDHLMGSSFLKGAVDRFTK
ncbi:hypothetical protein UA08_08970 [Talaromyces atroroseus]|uniref:Uncharacterized protein n=1 Tax=Talaromyces atroroseus TaxID=1441469 RepID=A0A1Q5Q7U2_TALAT|nr:hypothetical protein UA08_08970 [Talaromyces atroroseus]OKL55741.1 hypothetical protein UA08_08970 [Talaromyces atroroseus]